MSEETIERRLNDEEYQEIRDLSARARTSPVMLVGGVDINASAWGAVRVAWEKIADKYGVEVDTIGPGSTPKHFTAKKRRG